MVWTLIYLLSLAQKVLFGPPKDYTAIGFGDLSARELTVLIPLARHLSAHRGLSARSPARSGNAGQGHGTRGLAKTCWRGSAMTVMDFHRLLPYMVLGMGAVLILLLGAFWRSLGPRRLNILGAAIALAAGYRRYIPSLPRPKSVTC